MAFVRYNMTMRRFRRFGTALLAAGIILIAVLAVLVFIATRPPKPLPHLPFEAPIEQQIDEQVASIMDGHDPDLPLPIVVNGKTIKNLKYDEIRQIFLGEGFTEKKAYDRGSIESAIYRSLDGSVFIDWRAGVGCEGNPSLAIYRLKRSIHNLPSPKIAVGIGGFVIGEKGIDSRLPKEPSEEFGATSHLSRGAYHYYIMDGQQAESDYVLILQCSGATSSQFINPLLTEKEIRNRIDICYGKVPKRGFLEMLKDNLIHVWNLIK